VEVLANEVDLACAGGFEKVLLCLVLVLALVLCEEKDVLAHSHNVVNFE